MPAPRTPDHRDHRERRLLEKLACSHTAGYQQVIRARIVLDAAGSYSNAEISRRRGMVADTVRLWRGRYADEGMAGLADRRRSGRPPHFIRYRQPRSKLWPASPTGWPTSTGSPASTPTPPPAPPSTSCATSRATPLGLIAGGKSSIYLTDNVGSVIGLSGSCVCPDAGYSYIAYGALVSKSAGSGPLVTENLLGYTGAHTAGSTGYVHDGARCYDP